MIIKDLNVCSLVIFINMLLYVFLGAKCSGILNSIQTHHKSSLILHVAERNMPQKFIW